MLFETPNYAAQSSQMRVVACQLSTTYTGASLYAKGVLYAGLAYTNVFYDGSNGAQYTTDPSDYGYGYFSSSLYPG